MIVSCSPSASCIIPLVLHHRWHDQKAVHSLTLEQAHELIYKLLDRITELEDRLNQRSGNSTKPPPVMGLEVLRLNGDRSHSGELFRQRILPLMVTAKRLRRSPAEWLRAIVRACIEKTDYSIPVVKPRLVDVTLIQL